MCDPTIPLWRSVIERVARSFGGWQEKKKTSWKTQLGQFSGSLSHKECPPCSEDVFMDRRAELGQNILQKLLHNNQTCDVAICVFIFGLFFKGEMRLQCEYGAHFPPPAIIRGSIIIFQLLHSSSPPPSSLPQRTTPLILQLKADSPSLPLPPIG